MKLEEIKKERVASNRSEGMIGKNVWNVTKVKAANLRKRDRATKLAKNVYLNSLIKRILRDNPCGFAAQRSNKRFDFCSVSLSNGSNDVDKFPVLRRITTNIKDIPRAIFHLFEYSPS